MHKFLQTRAGQHHGIGRFYGFDLPDTEGIIMEAGDGFRDEPCHRQACAFAEPAGEFIDRQGSGGDVCLRCRSGTADQKEEKY